MLLIMCQRLSALCTSFCLQALVFHLPYSHVRLRLVSLRLVQQRLMLSQPTPSRLARP